MGVVGLNPDDPPDYIRIRSASDVNSDSGSVIWRSGGRNIMHKDMDDFSYRQHARYSKARHNCYVSVLDRY